MNVTSRSNRQIVIRRFNWRKLLRVVVVYLTATAIAFWVLAPVAWLVRSSLSPEVELLAFPPKWLPQQITFENYTDMFLQYRMGADATGVSQSERIPRALLNSFFVASFVTLINLIFGSLAAYAFGRLTFRFRNGLLVGLLASRMVPSLTLVVPFFLLFNELRLLNTVWAIIIAQLAITVPFTVWILRGYIADIPIDLERSARIDGCSRIQSIVRITLPLALPGLIAAGLFAFMVSWNDFIFPLIFISTFDAMTVQPVIAGFYTNLYAAYGEMFAAATLASVPPLIIVLILQKYLAQGLLSGAAKG